MRLTGLMLSAALACEAFVPHAPPAVAHVRLALSAPGPRFKLRNGATQTRAHLDPTHAHHFADVLQVRVGGMLYNAILAVSQCVHAVTVPLTNVVMKSLQKERSSEQKRSS